MVKWSSNPPTATVLQPAQAFPHSHAGVLHGQAGFSCLNLLQSQTCCRKHGSQPSPSSAPQPSSSCSYHPTNLPFHDTSYISLQVFPFTHSHSVILFLTAKVYRKFILLYQLYQTYSSSNITQFTPISKSFTGLEGWEGISWSFSPTSCTKSRPPTVCCTGKHPGGLWLSPKETPQPLNSLF